MLLAWLAAYAALDLSGRITVTRHWTRAAWLAAGASAMGLGIWSMHYIGMLAFHLPVPVFYHLPTVVLSLVAAIAASAVALFTVGREKMGLVQVAAGSISMGLGITAMHYIGMAAMRLPAMMDYRPGRVALSVALAIVISFAALILSFRVRQENRTSARKVVSAAIMGSAIPLMHYTGMWAVAFHPAHEAFIPGTAVQVSLIGIVGISVTSFFALAATILTAFLDRLLAAQRQALISAREGEAHFRVLAEAVPGVVWTAGPDGSLEYCNRQWYELTGLTEEQTLGNGWSMAIHPEDRTPCLKEWEHALHSGDAFVTEYRLRDAERGYRWHLSRATPVRDSAGIVRKWCGTCTEIEEQKHHQQTLEKQITERTAELADANARLQEEMLERDLARLELDRQNERMLSQLKERSHRATLLAKMGEHLQSCMSKDEVFAAALGFGPRIFPATRGAVAVLNSARNLVQVSGSWADCALPVPEFEPANCWALRTGHPHLVLAGDKTATCAHAAGVDHTYLCVPVQAQGEALGVLHFQATDEAPMFDDTELSFKTTFAGQVGLSIANIRLRDALRTQSIKDPLTGLYNRRYLDETLEREIRRAGRSDLPVSVLMLDIDHFKRFNDTHGHDAGDAVLRETSNFLSAGIRAEDFACRYGGEEFVVVLPTATVQVAQARAERLRLRLRELSVMHQGHPLERVTASIGVAEFPRHGLTAKDLLSAADAALYQAKRRGRNMVVVAEVPAVDLASNSPVAAHPQFGSQV